MMDISTNMKPYPKYKDSGVEWLGEIPEGWELKKFKFLSSVQKGQMPKKIDGNCNEASHPYLSMDYLRGGECLQFVQDNDAYKVDGGVTLLLWDGSNSGEFILSREGVISSTVAHIDFTSSRLQKNFAHYSCSYIERELRSSTVGMGIPHVDGDVLKNSFMVIPSFNEQVAIASFLDEKVGKIDEAIAQKEQLIELLTERKQIIIQNAATKGLNPNAPMKDSGIEWIGQIPEHWEVEYNRTLFTERNQPGEDGLPLLSVSIHSGVSSAELSDDENIRGKIKIQDKSNYKLVETGDIAYNMMRAWQGGIGHVTNRGMVSPAYVVATPNKKLSSEYFELQYRMPVFIQEMNRASKGITDFRKRLYWDEFKVLQTILPPELEQREVVSYIKAISMTLERAVGQANQAIGKLKEYKATLINSAVTGKINVSQYGH
jgi:type I restriction enzyme S subunit